MATPKSEKTAEKTTQNSKRVWKTPQDLWDDFKIYVELKQDNKAEELSKSGILVNVKKPLPITIEGFCAHYYIQRRTFYRVKDYTNFEQEYEAKVTINGTERDIQISYADIIARINEYIEQYTNENAAIGNFEARWYETYMTNKFKYSRKVDTLPDNKFEITFNIPRPGDKMVLNADGTTTIEGHNFNVIDEGEKDGNN